MEDKLLDWLPMIWPALMLILSAIVVPRVNKWLDSKIKNESWEGAAHRASQIFALAVAEVGQTYVDAIKQGRSDGKLDEAEKKEALRRAKKRAKELLGADDGYAVVREVVVGDAEGFVEAGLEAAVAARKRATPALISGEAISGN